MKKVLALLVSCTLSLSLADAAARRTAVRTAEGSGEKVRISDWL
ncbi:MAG: hypothetical protein ACLTW9_08935 [Enterocloster sp.]